MATDTRSPLSPVAYEDLKSLIAANSASDATHKKAASAIAKAKAEAAQSKLETEQLRHELSKLREETVQLRERRQKDKLAAAAAAETHRQEVERKMQQTIQEAISKEAMRSASEVKLLKQAAREDLQAVKIAARAELDMACASCEQREVALREMMRLRSVKHAHRLREVIASEEACHADLTQLEGRLRESALRSLALGVRLARAERTASSYDVEVQALLVEVQDLEDELEESDAARLAVEEASAEADAIAEAEVLDLREQVEAVAEKHKQWRRKLAARHENDVAARAHELVKAAVQEARAEMQVHMQNREAEHSAEVQELRQALAAAAAREAAHQEEAKALSELLN